MAPGGSSGVFLPFRSAPKPPDMVDTIGPSTEGGYNCDGHRSSLLHVNTRVNTFLSLPCVINLTGTSFSCKSNRCKWLRMRRDVCGDTCRKLTLADVNSVAPGQIAFPKLTSPPLDDPSDILLLVKGYLPLISRYVRFRLTIR